MRTVCELYYSLSLITHSLVLHLFVSLVSVGSGYGLALGELLTPPTECWSSVIYDVHFTCTFAFAVMH